MTRLSTELPQTPSTPARRFVWERALRSSRLASRTRLVAYAVATYANADGTRARPGVAELAGACALPKSTVRQHLGVLRDSGFVVRVSKGSASGRRAKADEYRLTVPVDHRQLASTDLPEHHRQLASTDLPEHHRQLASTDLPEHHRQLASTDLPEHHRQLASGTPLASQRNTAGQPAPTRPRPEQDQQPGARIASREQLRARLAQEVVVDTAAALGCTSNQAYQAIMELLTDAERRGNPIAHPGGYVRATLRENPERVRAYIPVVGRRLRSECGECGARSGDLPGARMVQTDRGLSRCPNCHPGSAQARTTA
jgi:DNA-binding transcriptional ArsR family regulator